MTKIHHLNCGALRPSFLSKAICHCLLLEDKNGFALVDTGFGIADVQDPVRRIGQSMIDRFSVEFDERNTAIRQIQKMGLDPGDVGHCILTHLDFDHVGGLADFPAADVHLGEEEYRSLKNGSPRYRQIQFEHNPKFNTYGQANTEWYGLPSRKIEIGFGSEIFLIPLFGHTAGHCGVAIGQKDKWVLHAGDAFFSGQELTEDDHPVTDAAVAVADNDVQRIESFRKVREIAKKHKEITILCYHDPF